jgi:hypothetical protein
VVVPTLKVARQKSSEKTNGTNEIRAPIAGLFLENGLVGDMRTSLFLGSGRLIGSLLEAHQSDRRIVGPW